MRGYWWVNLRSVDHLLIMIHWWKSCLHNTTAPISLWVSLKISWIVLPHNKLRNELNTSFWLKGPSTLLRLPAVARIPEFIFLLIVVVMKWLHWTLVNSWLVWFEFYSHFLPLLILLEHLLILGASNFFHVVSFLAILFSIWILVVLSFRILLIVIPFMLHL